VAFSSQANYTDRATVACRRSYCQLFQIEGVAWSAQRIPGRYFGFLDRSRYFFIQIAPQLSSRGWVDPIPDPLLLRKSGSAGNRTRDLWICSQELWPLDHNWLLYSWTGLHYTMISGCDVAICCPYISVVMMISIFWFILLLSPLTVNRRFWGICCQQLQGRRIKIFFFLWELDILMKLISTICMCVWYY
jgi:hypothetical protein